MEIRWMKYKNENGEKENFYPVTHAQAIVYGEDGEKTFADLESDVEEAVAKAESVNSIANSAKSAADEAIEAINNLTAEDVGALPLTGGTMSGNNVYLNNGYALLQGNPTNFTVVSYEEPNDINNSRLLTLKNSNNGQGELYRALTLHDISDSTETQYNIFGEHNTVPVANGGTGATSLTSGAALIGNGTGAVTTRNITNNTSNAACSGENLATCNTVNNHVVNKLNRSSGVTAADTNYGTYMARAIAAGTSTPSSLTNGVIYLQY